MLRDAAHLRGKFSDRARTTIVAHSYTPSTIVLFSTSRVLVVRSKVSVAVLPTNFLRFFLNFAMCSLGRETPKKAGKEHESLAAAHRRLYLPPINITLVTECCPMLQRSTSQNWKCLHLSRRICTPTVPHCVVATSETRQWQLND